MIVTVENAVGASINKLFMSVRLTATYLCSEEAKETIVLLLQPIKMCLLAEKGKFVEVF